MKALSYTVFLFLFLAAASASGQDAGMSDVDVAHERDPNEGVKAVFSPGEMEVRYIPRASGVYAPSDSIALQIHDFPMQQAAQRAEDKSAEKQGAAKPKDDSILTFNFLYYIIQKYKLQDIID